VEFYGEPVFVSDAFMTGLQQSLTRLPAIGAMASDGTRGAPFAPTSGGPFKGYEGIFNPALSGVDRTGILLACIKQDFWREQTKARTATEITDDSVLPNTGL
jgi:hypothetical protein